MGKSKQMFEEARQEDTDHLDDEYWFERYEQERNARMQQHYNMVQEGIDKTPYVFVYGTLRKGWGNHRLLEGVEKYADAITLKKYAMYASGIPFVTEYEPHTHIVGELYKVEDVERFSRLDTLEGHPESYCRKVIEVLTKDSEVVEAWIYFYEHLGRQKESMFKCPNGDFKDYYKTDKPY